jgi:hypothetical protein
MEIAASVAKRAGDRRRRQLLWAKARAGERRSRAEADRVADLCFRGACWRGGCTHGMLEIGAEENSDPRFVGTCFGVSAVLRALVQLAERAWDSPVFAAEWPLELVGGFPSPVGLVR